MCSEFRIPAPRSDLGAKEHVQSTVRGQRLSPVYVFKYQVSRGNLVGADVNELAPMLDVSGVSTATACKVLRELMLAILGN